MNNNGYFKGFLKGFIDGICFLQFLDPFFKFEKIDFNECSIESDWKKVGNYINDVLENKIYNHDYDYDRNVQGD